MVSHQIHTRSELSRLTRLTLKKDPRVFPTITSLMEMVENLKSNCFLFQTFDQFEFDGCDNCDEFLRMKNNRDNVYDCTSSNFDGLVLIAYIFFKRFNF